MLLIIPVSIYLIILVGVIAGLISTRKKVLGYLLLALIAAPFLPLGFRWLYGPIQLEKADVIGRYEIARSVYPSSQAEWQHKTYTLDITPTQVIVHDSRTATTWESPITWFTYPSYRWKFSNNDPRHHVIADGPAIYRTSSSYYYVFKSPLYGNMFFQKK